MDILYVLMLKEKKQEKRSKKLKKLSNKDTRVIANMINA
jgi:hypothetical protein